MEENKDENKELVKEEVEEKVSKISINKNTLKVVLISLGVIVAIFGLLIFFTLGYNKIYNGIRVNGVDVGGLTELQAINRLNEHYKSLSDINITLHGKEKDTSFKAKDVNAVFESEKAVKVAFDTGREGRFFKKIFDGIKYRITRKNIEYDVTIDIKKFDKQIDLVSEELENKLVQPTYARQGDKLIISTGITGFKINHTELRQQAMKDINNLRNTEVFITATEVKPDKVDIDKIQNEIKKNVQDAEYISDTGVLVDQIIGIEIKDVEEAKKIAESITEEGMQFSIPLKITLPETTMDNVMEELFQDQLSTFTTYFKVSEKERTENVKLAAESINNVILMPGQEFSYNNVVGERTTERGFKTAKVYQAGQIVDGLGGGICQVSSTLYNAVIGADLEILERRNHSLPVGYVKLGADATVVYGVTDFRFRNNQQYPIRIESQVSGGSLTISIKGINTNPNKKVEIQTQTVAVLNFAEKIIQDPNLPMGTEKVIQKGRKGYKVKSYRVTKENGVEVDRKIIDTDTYSPIAQIKKVSLTEESLNKE